MGKVAKALSDAGWRLLPCFCAVRMFVGFQRISELKLSQIWCFSGPISAGWKLSPPTVDKFVDEPGVSLPKPCSIGFAGRCLNFGQACNALKTQGCCKPASARRCTRPAMAGDAAICPLAWRWLLQSSWLMARLSAWLLPPSLSGMMCSSVAAAGNTCSPHTQQGTTPCSWRATVL